MRSRSPIEVMVDKACGLDRASYVPPPQITLRCCHCGRTKQADKDETDPEGTAIVEMSCLECMRSGDRPDVLYYDAEGRWFNGETFIKLPEPE